MCVCVCESECVWGGRSCEVCKSVTNDTSHFKRRDTTETINIRSKGQLDCNFNHVIYLNGETMSISLSLCRQH